MNEVLRTAAELGWVIIMRKEHVYADNNGGNRSIRSPAVNVKGDFDHVVRSVADAIDYPTDERLKAAGWKAVGGGMWEKGGGGPVVPWMPTLTAMEQKLTEAADAITPERLKAMGCAAAVYSKSSWFAPKNGVTVGLADGQADLRCAGFDLGRFTSHAKLRRALFVLDNLADLPPVIPEFKQ